MVKLLKDISYSSPENEHSLEQNERTVYLVDLSLEITEAQIEDFFNSIDLKPWRIVKLPYSSFCYVTFESLVTVNFLLDKKQIFMNEKYVRVLPFSQSNNFDPNANLIIKNLESFLYESDIIEKFKTFGEILSCKLVRDARGTNNKLMICLCVLIKYFFLLLKGESKCYAYLQFKYRTSAVVAIDNLNNTYWDEKYDPDYLYQKYKENLMYMKQRQHLNQLMIDFNSENDIIADINNTKSMHHGKKIYVGIFKKKDEYYKTKKEKEGKPSNLYVKNFGSNFGDRDLFNLFKSFGSIKSAKVRRQKLGLIEKPLGCGFVDFEEPEEAEKARLALNGYILKDSGRIISVTYADCKSRRMRKKLEENNTDTNNSSRQSPVSNYENNQFSDIESKVSETETPLNSSFDLTHSDEFDLSINGSDKEDRNRSVSMSSETSFDLILFNWSERWNREVYSEYKLF